MSTAGPSRSTASASADLPLAGIRVADFTTLLPGPLATLMMRRAGAEIIKIEPPGGDPMRGLMSGGAELFDLLNRGKRGVEVDLRSTSGRDAVSELVATCDVVVEQFRPGVMRRLGFDAHRLIEHRPALIWASITGYGQHGELAAVAGHDINYMAEAGLLTLFGGPDGAPGVPPLLLADICGGAFPAFMNVLLALLRRERTGRGAILDIAMTRGLQALAVSVFPHLGGAARPGVAAHPLDGHAANYRCYPCADGRWLAVGALEPKFWKRFGEIVGIGVAVEPEDPVVISGVAERLAAAPRDHWLQRFAGEDACCNAVRELGEVLEACCADALPLPLEPGFDAGDAAAPALGEANAEYLSR